MSARFAGKEITYYMACMLYDPLYGMPESAKDMSEGSAIKATKSTKSTEVTILTNLTNPTNLAT